MLSGMDGPFMEVNQDRTHFGVIGRGKTNTLTLLLKQLGFHFNHDVTDFACLVTPAHWENTLCCSLPLAG